MSRKLFAVILAAVVTVATGGFGGTLGQFATSLGAKFGFGLKFGSFLIRAGLGLALASQKPKLPTKGYTVNQKGSNLDHQIIYGKTKVAGAIVFDATSGSSNKYLHRVIALAGHEVNSFEEIWLNDYKLTLNSNGEVTSATNDGGSTTTTRYNGYVRVNTHTGADDQSADSDLVSEVTDWTSAHRLRGIAYMYVRLKFSADVFPNGIPELQAVVKGKKVYDPRNSTTAWSDNPALCIRDYLVSSYGLNADTTEIDEDLVKEAANYCDTSASNSDNFFTMNGAFTTGSQPIDVLNDMLTSMCGVLWYSQGEWRMRAAPAKISSSSFDSLVTLTLDEDDLRGPLDVNTRHSRRDNFNVIKGTWRGEDSNWQDTDYPEYKVAQAVTDDGGEESVFDMPLNFTDNSAEAERIARIVYERNRQQLTVSGTFGLKAMKCQVGDFIQLDNARMGWTSKYFEVTEWSFGMDGMDLAINMVLREISYDVFDEISSYTTLENDNTTLASPFDVQSPTGLSVAASSQVVEDGTTVNRLVFTWSVTDESDVANYIVGWRIGTSGTYNEVVVTDKKYQIEPAVTGATYNIRVRAVNHLGVATSSSNAATLSHTVVGDNVAPGAPSSLSATGGHKLVKISWTNPTDNDLRLVEVYRSTAENGTYSLIGNTSSTSFVDAGLTDEVTRWYRVRAKDFSGNYSSYSNKDSATTLVAPDGETGPTGPRGAGRFNIEVDATAAGSFVTGTEYVITHLGDGSGEAETDFTLVGASENKIGVFFTATGAGTNDGEAVALPATSSQANTLFTDTNGNGIGTPVDKDQAIFHAGDAANQIAQKAWIYDGVSSPAVWIEQQEFIDGNLLIGGTITSDKINVTNLSALSANLGDVNIDNTLTLTAGGAGFLGGRTDSSQYADEGFYIARTDLGGDAQGFEVSHTSTYGSPEKFSGIIHTEGKQMNVLNPKILLGGSSSGGSSNITTSQNIGAVDQLSITVQGGGGGGGFGVDDGGSSGRTASSAGGDTRVKVRANSSTGTVLADITATGGLAGRNGAFGRGSAEGNGDSTTFGSGGAGGANQSQGGNAPSTSYGAGGGGGGGDAPGLFDSSGNMGEGGNAGETVSQVVDCSSASTVYLEIVSIGSGGTGSTAGDYNGGNGAPGIVSYTSPLGGTTEANLENIDKGSLVKGFTLGRSGSASLANGGTAIIPAPPAGSNKTTWMIQIYRQDTENSASGRIYTSSLTGGISMQGTMLGSQNFFPTNDIANSNNYISVSAQGGYKTGWVYANGAITLMGNHENRGLTFYWQELLE